MTTTIELRPRGPYNLRMTVGAVRDGTLRLHDDGAELVFATAAGPAHARVAQRGDGTLQRSRLDAPDAPCALDRLRFLLGGRRRHRAVPRPGRARLAAGRAAWRARAACARAAPEPACTRSCARSPGSSSRSRRRAASSAASSSAPDAQHAGLMLSPERADLARLSAAGVCASGLAPRRAAALVRISSLLDLERLPDRRAGCRRGAAPARAPARPLVGRRRSSCTASAATTAASSAISA